MQELQEINPAFAVGTMKGRKEFVSDMGKVAVFTFVPGSRVVYINICGDCQAYIKDCVFLIMKAIMIFNNNVVELSGGNIKPKMSVLLRESHQFLGF